MSSSSCATGNSTWASVPRRLKSRAPTWCRSNSSTP